MSPTTGTSLRKAIAYFECYGEATAESFKRGKCCSVSESLVGDWNPVGVLKTACSNHNDVNEVPNAACTEGDELENPGSNFTCVKMVDP